MPKLQTCVLLHNFLNKGGAEFDFEEWEIEAPEPDDPLTSGEANQPGKAAGKQKRKDVANMAEEFRDQGGCY
jgi:hypothetical protein